MNILGYISDKLDYIVEWFCHLILGVLVVTTFTQVICRYVFNNALSWPEELGSLLLVWLIFIGVSLVFKRKNHILVDFILNYAPPSYKRAIEFITLIFSFILVFIFIKEGFEFVKLTSRTFSAALEISHGLWYLSVPVSGIIISVHLISQLFHFIKGE